jgi:glycosyltransferase involved in cell wall biosynthesis/SAM-dependent methyltransferase
VFSTEFLHIVREYEIEEIAKHFPPGASILEIGGGTGFQARQLTDRGYKVTAIDVAASNYKNDRVFPVIDYDGKVFPFEDGTFDVVMSSNVLEHIVDLAQLHRESRRVLKPDGYCVHVMPSAVWRFWTGVANYVELFQRWGMLLPDLLPRRLGLAELKRPVHGLWRMAQVLRAYLVPVRHGEVGNAMTELWTFSRRYWVRHLRRHNCAIIAMAPMGLFYTGHMVLGKRWSMRWRQRAASVLGSACILYKIKPGVSTDEEAPVNVSSRMKVCFISPLGYGLYCPKSGYPFGGAEVQFFLLAHALAADPALRVTVLTTVHEEAGVEQDGPLTLIKRKAQGRAGVSTTSARAWLKTLPGYVAAFRDMWRTLGGIEADIYFHAGAGIEVGAYAVICRLLRRRFVFVVASSADLCRPKGQVQGALAWLFPLGVRLADAVVCRTAEQMQWLRDRYRRGGVLIRSAARHVIQIPPDMRIPRSTVLWVGRMHPLKQPGMFLDLAERFPKERCVMVIMRDSAHEDLARAIRARASGMANVSIHEDVPFTEIEKFFEQAKLTVNTSTYEGFPNTFVQAAMNATPILSWMVDPDGVLSRHRIGICAGGSFDGLVASAERLCALEGLRAELGKRAAEYALENHDLNRCAADVKALIQTLRRRHAEA